MARSSLTAWFMHSHREWTAVPIPQLYREFRVTQINPLTPQSVPQLFLMIQQSGVYPTRRTAWLMGALTGHRYTPELQLSHPVALIARATGPASNRVMMASSVTQYLERRVALEMTMRSEVEQMPLLLALQGLQPNSLSQGSPFSSALSIEFSKYPPLQLLPGVHFRRYCQDRSTEQSRLLKAFPCSTSELSHIATVANDQQVPQLPCALTGVTAPWSRQSSEFGDPSLSRPEPSEDTFTRWSSIRCCLACSRMSGGRSRLVRAAWGGLYRCTPRECLLKIW